MINEAKGDLNAVLLNFTVAQLCKTNYPAKKTKKTWKKTISNIKYFFSLMFPYFLYEA